MLVRLAMLALLALGGCSYSYGWRARAPSSAATVAELRALVEGVVGVAGVRETDDTMDIDLSRGTYVGTVRFTIDGSPASIRVRREPSELIVGVQSFKQADVDRAPCRARLDRICAAIDRAEWTTGEWEYEDSWAGADELRTWMTAALVLGVGGLVGLVGLMILSRRRYRRAA